MIRTRGEARVLVRAGLAALAVAALPAAASAAPRRDPAQALAALRRAALVPVPLAPARLPASLRGARTEWAIGRPGFSVHYARAGVDVTLTRSAPSAIRAILADAREAGVRATRVRIAGRTVVRVPAHHTVWMWREQGLAYSVAEYRLPRRDLGALLAALRPVGR